MPAKLLVIDPQNDFCELPGAALPVPGALDDMRRLAAFVREAAGSLADLIVTWIHIPPSRSNAPHSGKRRTTPRSRRSPASPTSRCVPGCICRTLLHAGSGSADYAPIQISVTLR